MSSGQESREETAEEKARESAERERERERERECRESTTKGGGSEEYKESAAEAARKAMEYSTAKKEEARERLAETEENTKEKLGETEESERSDEPEKRVNAYFGNYEGAGCRLLKDRRRRAASKSILISSIGSVTEAIKERLTMPKDVVEHKRAEAAAAAAAEDERGRREAENEDDAMLRVNKDADQMTGQWFNDVGTTGGDGHWTAARNPKHS